ncbi:MAG: DUF4386 family protein [Chloroflexi bacterium]|nr:DUF4386 family protein [Chloroflexota bacterium]
MSRGLSGEYPAGYQDDSSYLQHKAQEKALNMLSLSSEDAAAATDADRSMFLAAGQAMLAIYNGTAFHVNYLIGGAALLIISFVMLRSNIFSKATAYVGILAGVLMLVPSTAGTIGLYFALVSLVPWAIFSVLIARRLFQLGQGVSAEKALRS